MVTFPICPPIVFHGDDKLILVRIDNPSSAWTALKTPIHGIKHEPALTYTIKSTKTLTLHILPNTSLIQNFTLCFKLRRLHNRPLFVRAVWGFVILSLTITVTLLSSHWIKTKASYVKRGTFTRMIIANSAPRTANIAALHQNVFNVSMVMSSHWSNVHASSALITALNVSWTCQAKWFASNV